VEFALERAAAEKGVNEDQQKAVADQVHTGLEVLQAIRSITSEVYLEDEAIVCHTLTEIHDVEK